MKRYNKSIKDEAIRLRKNGKSLGEICSTLGVPKGTASLWLKDIKISKEQESEIKKNATAKTIKAIQKNYRDRRLIYQEKGKEKAKQKDCDYIAGCMLYWGEGAKNKNVCSMANTDLAMLIVFKKFLMNYFSVSNDKFFIAINAYTNLKSKEEIEKYWLDKLNLPNSCLKKSQWDCLPKSSKCKYNKLNYGTCTLGISNTEIVQEIFGAIQEYGSFINDKWLNGKTITDPSTSG